VKEQGNLISSAFPSNPAPICVLDEVDAPLDDANVERFCDLLDSMRQRTKRALWSSTAETTPLHGRTGSPCAIYDSKSDNL
jgi:ABC-type Mn2+/Zn2+ transport system ATPase subunit